MIMSPIEAIAEKWVSNGHPDHYTCCNDSHMAVFLKNINLIISAVIT